MLRTGAGAVRILTAEAVRARSPSTSLRASSRFAWRTAALGMMPFETESLWPIALCLTSC